MGFNLFDPARSMYGGGLSGPKPFQIFDRPISAPLPREERYSVLGLDLGQAIDPSAGVLLDKEDVGSDFIGPRDPYVRCRYIYQWPLGTSYLQVAEEAIDLNPSVIIPEFNDVGRPFVDILRNRAIVRGYTGKIKPIVTARSNQGKIQEHKEARGDYLTVPKVDLVSSIRALSQAFKRHNPVENKWEYAPLLVLPHPDKEPMVALLYQQLQDFQMRYSKTAGNLTLQASQGSHDDLVMALGLACFFISRYAGSEPGLVFGHL